MKAKKGIEVGTFTGYSALCLAESLPEDGQLTCLDVNYEFANVAQKYFKLANLDKKIQINIGPANNYLDKLIQNEENLETFDFAYVDADKRNYLNYYERLLKLLRKGGIIFFDNILWGGLVMDENVRKNDPDTKSLFEVNQFALRDPRVLAHTIFISDGLMIVEKK